MLMGTTFSTFVNRTQGKLLECMEMCDLDCVLWVFVDQCSIAVVQKMPWLTLKASEAFTSSSMIAKSCYGAPMTFLHTQKLFHSHG